MFLETIPSKNLSLSAQGSLPARHPLTPRLTDLQVAGTTLSLGDRCQRIMKGLQRPNTDARAYLAFAVHAHCHICATLQARAETCLSSKLTFRLRAARQRDAQGHAYAM